MRFSRLALVALALPLVAGCSSLVDNQTMGPKGTPAGGAIFANYVAVGTSISAGIQSGGISDSTQRQAFPYLLAQAMGLAPNSNWFYPGFTAPGCPGPYTNPLTGARVGGSGATDCNLISPVSVPGRQGYFNDLGVPSIRAAQVLNIHDLTYPATDTLFLAQFITGSRNPIDIVLAAQPTFVTLEIGANDVLGAATHGNAALLTPVATFESQFTAIADSIGLTGAKVAVANIPNVTVIPHFSAGVILFCLRYGGAECPAAAGLPPATLPFSLASFVVDSSCALSAFGGVGDSMLVTFPAIATIAGTLQLGGAATLNCAAGTATVNQGTGFVPAGAVLTKATTIAIVTNVLTLDAFIQQQATTRGWAYVDLNGLLSSHAAAIPKFPELATPDTLFGVLFSYDGIHPNAAGHKAIADAFVAAINGTYGTSLTPP
jgi:lysophospholipase L1-like esterase